MQRVCSNAIKSFGGGSSCASPSSVADAVGSSGGIVGGFDRALECLDGWRLSELKQLPDFFLAKLVDSFSVIEQGGTWPDDLAQGVMSLIRQGEGTAPFKLRPISVMSVLYRLWEVLS